MRFNLKTSQLLYEVKYQNANSKENYTNEKLYIDRRGFYFIHFEGGKESKYAVRLSNGQIIKGIGNKITDKESIEIWKCLLKMFVEVSPNQFKVKDLEKEEKEYLLFLESIPKDKIPF